MRYGQRVPEERRHVVLRLAEHRLRVDRQVPLAGAQDVVVVEVAVDERLPADLERRVQLPCERDQLTPLLIRPLGLVEPARHVIPDPAKRLRRRPPEPQPDLDRDGRRLVLGQLRDVASRPGALDQERAPRSVAAQQAYGAVAVPERERVRLLVGFVVLGRSHLQHRVVAGRGDEGMPRERKRRSELDPPGSAATSRGDPRERLEIGWGHRLTLTLRYRASSRR